MSNPIAQMKARLARVRVGSFRYKMTKTVWSERRLQNARACSFYWWYMPSSAVAVFLLGIAYVLWLIATYLFVVPLAWLAGFTPERQVLTDTVQGPDATNEWRWHGGYGYDPVAKKRRVIAPQHVVLGVVAGAIITWFIYENRGDIPWAEMAFISAVVVGTISAVTALGYAITRKSVKENWHKICPPLQVEGAEDY